MLDVKGLIELAKRASLNAYAPYSGYKVGCAVITSDGRAYTGVNVENSAYGSTVCAERIAIGNAVTAGERNIAGIAVYNKDSMPVPCGACLQVISELAPDARVIAASEEGHREYCLNDLLPHAFSEQDRLKR